MYEIKWIKFHSTKKLYKKTPSQMLCVKIDFFFEANKNSTQIAWNWDDLIMTWSWNIRHEVRVVMFWSRVYATLSAKDFNIKYKYYHTLLSIDFTLYDLPNWSVQLHNRYQWLGKKIISIVRLGDWLKIKGMCVITL